MILLSGGTDLSALTAALTALRGVRGFRDVDLAVVVEGEEGRHVDVGENLKGRSTFSGVCLEVVMFNNDALEN